ncbi:MAG: GAF domain-containing protein [Alphaproteobacteria bacterium]
MAIRGLMLPARLEALLLEISTNPAIDEGDLETTHGVILKTMADGLGTARVGIWMFDEKRDAIRCLALVDKAHRVETEDTSLDRATYPRYFAALDTERAIVAHDARIDTATSEFAPGYLTPLGITSMLDVPVRQHGQMVGIICSEHVGPARQWRTEEAAFAAAVADLLGRAMTAALFRGDVKSLADATRAHARRLVAEGAALRTDLADLEKVVDGLRRSGDPAAGGTADELSGIARRLRSRADDLERSALELESRSGAVQIPAPRDVAALG